MFRLSFSLHSYFVYAKREGETVYMGRLVRAIAAPQCNKCHHLVCWSISLGSTVMVKQFGSYPNLGRSAVVVVECYI